jgi:DNA (cytosine-5)-methyltransferase 1
MIRAYYNEIDAFACEWLRELMKDGLISEGDIDERSITEVDPQDLRGYTRLHFFAGTGGWDYALQLAGWDDSQDGICWTGSCPCEPFSVAGKGEGFKDERHLFPVWLRLIRECRPRVVIGEEVENAIKHGWLDLVFGELERYGYACGAASFPACSVGAPHQRQRLYFVGEVGDPDDDGRFAYGNGARADAKGETASKDYEPPVSAFWDDVAFVECRGGTRRPVPAEPSILGLADGIPGGVGRGGETDRSPLCYETPNRAQRLRGYGNAIVPQAGAAFVRAFMETKR